MMNKLKKALAALTTAALMAGTVAMLPASAAETVSIKGDLTGDGICDLQDAVGVLRCYSYTILNQEIPDKVSYKDNFTLDIVDINGDGSINVSDAVYILIYTCSMMLHPTEDGVLMTIDAFYANGFDRPSYTKTVAQALEVYEKSHS